MKKWLKISLLSLLGLIVVVGVLMWLEFGPLVKGAIVGGTLWTIVMDLTHPSVTYYSRRHFDKPFRFELKR
jgi:hypothetical protein